MIDWVIEKPIILKESLSHGVDPFFIATIRKVENGPPKKEYGVMLHDMDTYLLQLHVTCNTVCNRIISHAKEGTAPLFAKMYFGYGNRLCYAPEFISYFGNIWAPENVRNDPNNLNVHWIPNAIMIYNQFCKQGDIF